MRSEQEWVLFGRAIDSVTAALAASRNAGEIVPAGFIESIDDLRIELRNWN